MTFWERTLCQNIYYDVLDQIKDNLIQRNGGQPLHATLDMQLSEVLKLPLFCSIDDILNYRARITRTEDQTQSDSPQFRDNDDVDDILKVEINQIVFSKLLDIQFDMTSFEIPATQVREIVQKFLNVPDLVDKVNGEIILG